VSFSADLNRFADKAQSNTEQARQAIVMALFKAVIFDSPVDTGRLRGNWQATLNQPATTAIPREDKTGALVIAEVGINLGTGDVANWLANNLPYARRIEYGWSRVKAPEGMVRKNIARIQQIIRGAVRGSS
jgi:hypothetical protein